MKIIENSIIPFKGFKAINICGILFVRKESASKLTDIDINHEEIHTAQMKELLYIGFYIAYLFEWLFKVLFKYPFSHKAYKDISFEREAYKYQKDLDYLKTRKHYTQWRKQ